MLYWYFKSYLVPLVTASQVQALYLSWLKGYSLRYLAKTVDPQVSHSTIAAWFVKAYGPDATDVKATSLQRSLLSDYPDDLEVEQWVLNNLQLTGSKQHRSHHNLDQLTRFQVVRKPELMEYLAISEDDPLEALEPGLDFLRLPLVLCMLTYLVSLLWHVSQKESY